MWKLWKNNRLPITVDDKDWLIESFLFFDNRLGKDFLLSRPLVLPTKDFFDLQFSQTEKDALYVFRKITEIMQVDLSRTKLTFYSEPRQIELTEGLTTIQGDYKSTAGKYIEYNDGAVEIMIERNQLKNPISLIATMAHEVAHLKLLGEGILKQNDELLTELAVLFYGFGIFNANTSIARLNTWSGLSSAGWQLIGGDGYLHYRVHGFALALYAHYRADLNPKWSVYLEKEVYEIFLRSFNYIRDNPGHFTFLA